MGMLTINQLTGYPVLKVGPAMKLPIRLTADGAIIDESSGVTIFLALAAGVIRTLWSKLSSPAALYAPGEEGGCGLAHLNEW